FESKGIPSYIESFTNQQFVILPNDAMEKLKKYIYEFEMKIDENHSCVRFCTSWSSKKEDVSELVKDIKLL
ncbi:MAG: low specificity L-threonine aldolase, partial [Clostridia bacterium]|nr:low specificity L-threonine aldolase [Clostridia bacterium]